MNIDIQARRAAQRLADEIADLRELTRDLATTPQLTRSSIDSGSVIVRDGDGSLMGEVGLQHDGTWGASTLNGPEPAAPTPPVLDGGVGVLAVRWDGGLVDQDVLPLDFEAVEVYAATGRDPEITADDRQGVITAQAGGAKVLSLAAGTWRVGLVTRAVSGRRSPMSGLSAGLVQVPADAEAIGEAIDEAKQALEDASGLLDAIGAADGPDGVAQAIVEYLTIGLDQIGVGEGPADPAVLDILYQDIIVSRLLVAEKIITGELLADGAVTARTLNVVHTDPESGYGLQLTPEGLVLLGPEGNPIVSIRADGSVAIAVLDADGAIVGGIDETGSVTGRTVSANEGLEYKGNELEDLLNAYSRGIIAHTRNTSAAVVGTTKARVFAVTFRTPPDNRKIRVQIKGTASSGPPRLQYELRQSAGNSVSGTNSLQAYFFTPNVVTGAFSFNHTHTRAMNEWGWPYDATITLGCFVVCNDAGTAVFDPTYHQEMIVEDMGPALNAVAHTPWVPSSGGGTGGGNENETGTRLYTQTFDSTWVQSFWQGPGGARYPYNPPAQQRGYTGYWSSTNGVLSSMYGFNRAAIMAFCSGADMVSARLRIKNDHSGNNSTTVIELWNARADSRPNNESGRARIGSPSFSPGQTRWLGVDAAMPELKSGATSAFRINPPSWRASTADYGYFNGTAVLEITVKK